MISVYHQNPELKQDIGLRSSSGTRYELSSYHSFTINKSNTFFGDITIKHMSPYNFVINELTHINRFDFSLRYVFPNKGFTFFLIANDVFRGTQMRITSTTDTASYKRSSYYDERIVYLGMFYKFGNKKMRERVRVSNIEKKEKTRIKE